MNSLNIIFGSLIVLAIALDMVFSYKSGGRNWLNLFNITNTLGIISAVFSLIGLLDFRIRVFAFFSVLEIILALFLAVLAFVSGVASWVIAKQLRTPTFWGFVLAIISFFTFIQLGGSPLLCINNNACFGIRSNGGASCVSYVGSKVNILHPGRCLPNLPAEQ